MLPVFSIVRIRLLGTGLVDGCGCGRQCDCAGSFLRTWPVHWKKGVFKVWVEHLAFWIGWRLCRFSAQCFVAASGTDWFCAQHTGPGFILLRGQRLLGLLLPKSKGTYDAATVARLFDISLRHLAPYSRFWHIPKYLAAVEINAKF